MIQYPTLDNWDLSQIKDSNRRYRLLHPPSGEEVITAVAQDARAAAEKGKLSVKWEPAKETVGFYRLWARIPIQADNFDLLFNGRSGYRAHYYVSADDGAYFNRTLIDALTPIILSVGIPSSPRLNIIKSSIAARWSKVWVADDTQVFGCAPPDEFRPSRWAEKRRAGNMGLRAPRPAGPAIDVKGTWIRPSDGAIWIDPIKKTRDQDLHRTGFV
jgi:hypothetical protein